MLDNLDITKDTLINVRSIYAREQENIGYSLLIAQHDCCSRHSRVKGCNGSGRTICNDGTLSPTCRC